MAPSPCDIRFRVPWDEYLALPGISITRLKELQRSPLHYRYRLNSPKETQPLSFGRAAHCAVLEPDRFDRDYAVWARRTSGGNLAPRNGKHWESFKEGAEGRSILTIDEYDAARSLQEAVRSNHDAMRYLGSGEPEVTMRWSMLGHQCKGRADWVARLDRVNLVGLKSSRDCRPFQFGRQAANLGYHLQWAWYGDGYKVISGGELPCMVEIVVEPAPPHAIVVYEVPDEILQQGFDEYSELLELLSECERTNYWPGPAPGIQTLSLPQWVYGEEELSYVE